MSISTRPAATLLPLAVAAVLGAGVLTGCGSDQAGSGPATATSPPTSSPATTAPDATATPSGSTSATDSPATATDLPTTAGSPEGLTSTFTMSRTGGFAGLGDRLVIRPDGRYVVSTKASGPVTRTLSAEQEAEVARAVDAADLAEQTSVRPDGTRSDTIVYAFGYGQTRYTTVDGQVPPEVDALITALQPLFSSPGSTP